MPLMQTLFSAIPARSHARNRESESERAVMKIKFGWPLTNSRHEGNRSDLLVQEFRGHLRFRFRLRFAFFDWEKSPS
jgi:hypothetical protein